MIVMTGGTLMTGYVYYRNYTMAYHRSRPYWHRHGAQLWSEPND